MATRGGLGQNRLQPMPALPSKPVSQPELHCSRRRCRIATAEKWRAQHSDDIGDVDAVDRVEHIHRDVEAVTFVPSLKTRNVEGLCKSHIELQGSRSAAGIAGHARRPNVGDGVPGVVKSCRNVEWLATCG